MIAHLPSPARREAVEQQVDRLCDRHKLSADQRATIKTEARRHLLRTGYAASAIALAARAVRRPERGGTGIGPEAA